MKLGTIERAFQLARTGNHPHCEAIAAQLRSEGYESVANHFASALLKKQLLLICREAIAAPEAVEV